MLSQMNAASADSIFANNIGKTIRGGRIYELNNGVLENVQAMEEPSPSAVEEPSAVEVIAATIIKKYRSATYDVHDKTYATEVLAFFDRERVDVQAKFNEFTDNLMAETHINRFSLLRAIDEYKSTASANEYLLSGAFEDMAFNCRPYQACVIC